jgi:hypothetical protein
MSVIGVSASNAALFGKFTYKIISALKEAGGAKSQYHEAVQSLESLLKILEELEQLALSNGDSCLAKHSCNT